MSRADGRREDQLRAIKFTRNWLNNAEGSVLVEFGKGNTEGLLVGRKAKSEQSVCLKPILDLASPSGLVSSDLIKHIELTRNRFGGSFWSILKPFRATKCRQHLFCASLLVVARFGIKH